MHPDRHPAEGNDLTQWLVEAGRRAREHDKAVLESSRISVEQKKASKPGWTRSAMMSLAALSFLQYYYFHVMVEIGKLPTVIVFLPPPLG